MNLNLIQTAVLFYIWANVAEFKPIQLGASFLGLLFMVAGVFSNPQKNRP